MIRGLPGALEWRYTRARTTGENGARGQLCANIRRAARTSGGDAQPLLPREVDALRRLVEVLLQRPSLHQRKHEARRVAADRRSQQRQQVRVSAAREQRDLVEQLALPLPAAGAEALRWEEER